MTTSKEEALLEPKKQDVFGKDFPSVFEECNSMILASIIVYGVVDLRRLAKMGVLKGCGIQELEELPISAAAIVRLVAQNRETLFDQIGEGSTELYLEAFDSLVEQDAVELDYNVETGETFLASFDVVQVGDEHSESELVHDISVNTSQKQITVAFRGCTTHADWRTSANPFLSSHSNPVMPEHCDDGGEEVNYNCCLSDEPKKVSVHDGFYNYLFRPAQHDQGTNKYDTILKSLVSLQKQYPGYHIYITGHSLGGALSTVFSFFAAASGIFRDPITCIPIASPMVGNLSFEEAFKSLERQGRLRCLRITNHVDIFTQLPDRGALLYASYYWGLPIVITSTAFFFLCCQNRVYRHVGMDLHLYGTSFKIKHAQGSFSTYCWRVMHDWKQHWKRMVQRIMTVPFACCCEKCCFKQDFNRNHGIQEHWKRLHVLSNELNHLYLNELYEEKRFSNT
jgi:hypothetical protein